MKKPAKVPVKKAPVPIKKVVASSPVFIDGENVAVVIGRAIAKIEHGEQSMIEGISLLERAYLAARTMFSTEDEFLAWLKVNGLERKKK